MSGTLKSRLAFIRASTHTQKPETKPALMPQALAQNFPGWNKISDYCLSRIVENPLENSLENTIITGFNSQTLNPNIKMIVNDILKLQDLGDINTNTNTKINTGINIADLLFFDLETTGLSGGAGTVAFLAAFGQYKISEANKLCLLVTQFLLLDYPGEYDFLVTAVDFISKAKYIVTYNGKTFDSQILKSRCLVNAVALKPFVNIDLLYASRRLWKRILSSCSQVSIETNVLKQNRIEDLSGAFAPQAWFSFLRSGGKDNINLIKICDHNVMDINGLANILLVINKIASDPIGTLTQYNFDIEKLSILWYITQKKQKRNFLEIDLFKPELEKQERYSLELLEAAAALNKPNAIAVLSIIGKPR
jgi:uncharacterized protein YprB with RNaseH-like and TPR domain